MTATLWASAADRQRIAEADQAVLLTGGYDGSGNYGDVLQLATAVETVGRLPGAPLPVVIVERETLGHHAHLGARYASELAGAAFVHYDDGGREFDDELSILSPGALTARSASYLYGGGYLNGWWGSRKASHAESIEGLSRSRAALPVVASGLQLDEAVVEGGAARALLSRAAWIGVRDADSLGYLRKHLPRAGAQAVLAGDDALPYLTHAPAVATRPLVNLHLNGGGWVSENPDAMADRVVAFLVELARGTGGLTVQPVIAYEDPRVSEQAFVSAALESRRDELERAGLAVDPPLDVLEDAVRGHLRRFREARLTVSCSYHVTLTSLMAGIPAMLLAENEYYQQKAAGLRNLFELEPGLVGTPIAAADVAPAANVFLDGAGRTALVGRLHGRAEEVAERYERGRTAVAEALAKALQERRPPWIRRIWRRPGSRRSSRGRAAIQE